MPFDCLLRLRLDQLKDFELDAADDNDWFVVADIMLEPEEASGGALLFCFACWSDGFL